MKKASLLFLFIFIQNIYAAVVDYCFLSSTALRTVNTHLQTVLSPQDEVIENHSSHCLNVVMKNDLKEELYRKWISKKFSIISSDHYGSTEVSTRPSELEHCRLEIEKITTIDKNTKSGQLSSTPSALDKKFKHAGVQKSSLLLSVGRPGSLRVDDDYLNVICKSKNSSRMFLDISLSGEKSSISTSVTLERGESLNLASLVEDLNDKHREISLKKGVVLERTKGQKQFEYFLRIKD